MTKLERRTLTRQARIVVREAAYNVVMLEHGPKDEAYSRAVYLYDLACDNLFLVDSEAREFIRITYQPTSHSFVEVKTA